MHSMSAFQIPAPTRPVLDLTTPLIYLYTEHLTHSFSSELIVFYLIFSCTHCFHYVLVNFSCLRVAVFLLMFLLIKTNIYILS